RSLLQQPTPPRQTSPHLLGASSKLSSLRSERFRRAFSLGCRRGAHCAVAPRLWLAAWCGYGSAHANFSSPNRLGGSNHLHALLANVYPCESRSGRHVAGVVCEYRPLGRTRTAPRRPNECQISRIAR